MIRFLKTRDVPSPTRANKYDAGIDFYVPQQSKEFIDLLIEKNPQISPMDINTTGIILRAGQRVLIPSGIHCQMKSPDRALIAANKSGVASKLGLIFGAQVVDFEYQGEIHLNILNVSTQTRLITYGMKMLQFLETPIFTSEVEITENIEPSEFYTKVTTRGAKGFGSTDKK